MILHVQMLAALMAGYSTSTKIETVEQTLFTQEAPLKKYENITIKCFTRKEASFSKSRINSFKGKQAYR